MKRIIYLVLSVSSVMGCRKPYSPPAIATPGSYLVVEGVINSGPDSTVIKLSKTVNLSGKTTANPVLNAVVTVESSQNTSYPLIARGNGRYVLNGLYLNDAYQYRLRIITPGDEYVSDFVSVLNSPPMDSVNYVTTNNGLNIYANTHDATNTVKYYRWDYQETWLIHSRYDSFYISNGDTVLTRDYINDQVYTCWPSDTSSNVILNSTAKLSKSIINNNLVTSVSSTSPKISTEYTIQVKQYALTGDAYNFWTNLKKNTEELGSIFDAQPSQVNGNIRSVTNPSEPVIGYISVGSTSNIRIFITNRQLPNWPINYGYPNCMLDTFYYVYYPPSLGATVPVNEVDEHINYDKGAIRPEIPVDAIEGPGGVIAGYSASFPECVDCTLRGTNIQPSFWK
jgi:hypothetical protein